MRIFNLIMRRPSWAAILQQALQVEKEKDEEYEVKGLGEFPGFQDFHIGVYESVLLNIVKRGLLYITEDAGSSRCFRVKNPELISEAIDILKEEAK